jgi:MFS family permease
MILSGLGDGILMVVAQLYFVSLGIESAALGTIFMLQFAATAVLTIPSGLLADRYGRFKVLTAGLFLFSAGMILFLTAKTIEVFGLSMILFGSSNATFVVLDPLYSFFFDDADMDRAFGLMTFLYTLSIAVGTLFGYIPPLLVGRLGQSLERSYWSLILVAMGFFLIRVPFVLFSTRGSIEPNRKRSTKLHLQSKSVVVKFSILNIIHQIGYNILFGLFPFYVNKKFGVGSDALGTLFFVSFFVSALANFLAPRASGKWGTLNTIILSFGLSAPFYFILSLAPNFKWLSTIYIIRRGIANLWSPLATSMFMKLLQPGEKATANSIILTTKKVSEASGNWLGGQIMQTSLNTPFYMGTGLYIINAVLFYVLLREGGKNNDISKSEGISDISISDL